MAAKSELDGVDRKILRILNTDGRASYQAIADEVGLSRPAVMERVKRLEEARYITGYAVRLDRGKLGLPITAFIAVRYNSLAGVGDDPGMRGLREHPGVLECHHVAGEDCYILKVAVPTLEGIEDVLRSVRDGAGTTLVTTKTTIVLSTTFEKPGVVPAELD
jgi:Lrp/AsnC family transcriptional regulator, leucine-responsive regulatory protein